MRIAVISVSNIFGMPYYFKYEKMICDILGSFDLIYWDRSLIEETVDPRVHCIIYHKKCAYNDEDAGKILNFYNYYRFVKKTIKEKQYDRIIILGTYSLLTFFITPFLVKNYNNKYILDIRDFTYEHIRPFYVREKKLIENSYSTFISSDGYRKFLPEWDYKRIHNCDTETIQVYQKHASEYKRAPGDPLRISFIGNVRYVDENVKLIMALKNDSRFILQYFGNGAEKIQEAALAIGAENVVCEGKFSHERTYEYYLRTDIINNVYGNSGIELTTALSNKLYFASALGKPILVSPGTYMEKISTENGLGFVVDFEKSTIGDELYDWFTHIYETTKTKNTMMGTVEEDEKIIQKAISDFLGLNIIR